TEHRAAPGRGCGGDLSLLEGDKGQHRRDLQPGVSRTRLFASCPLEGRRMTEPTYHPARTGLLFVDPYTDFLSEGGKIWPRVKAIAEEVSLIANLKTIDRAMRSAGMRVFIVPHRRWEPGDYESWCHPNPSQLGIMKRRSFACGEWGGDWHPDF